MNLAPADTRKVGPIYDLPIAVCLLAAMGQVPHQSLEGTALLGELSLHGQVRPCLLYTSIRAIFAAARLRDTIK